jgi:GNAT superfamily N-acetyltransferase
MIKVEQVDLKDHAQVNRFVQVSFDLYEKHPQWVPPFISDIKAMMNKEKHPYYEHSDADFFIALQDGKAVGRIAALENRPFNKYHDHKDAEFYLFETTDLQEVADALFNRVFEWARGRGLNHVVGPKGFGPLDGYGIQIEGFEHRQMMNMMNYNYPYYVKLVEAAGFTKLVDFVSCYSKREGFLLPEKALKAVHIVHKRGTFEVLKFKNKKHLVSWAKALGIAYNKSFVNNIEYYPLTEREIKFVVDNVLTIADHRLVKLILHKDEVVGFSLPFPDVSAAMQRGKGKLNPISIADLMLELGRTKWIDFNGIGILPEYQGLGGNALMYSEVVSAVNSGDFHFEHAELTQMAETATQIRKDLITLGVTPYKNHRVYQIHL